MVPCLFIDGVDLLTKKNKKMFLQLVSYAKECANNRLLRIVMISSEGSIMPILNKTSAMNRSACVVEVGEISYNQSLKHLVNGGIGEMSSTKLAQHFGGRFVYLNSCILLYQFLAGQGKSEDEIISETISTITNRRMESQRKVILTTPLADTVLSVVSKEGELVVGDMLNGASPGDQMLIEEYIRKLILANIPRYNVEGKVMWHSQIEKSAFKNQ